MRSTRHGRRSSGTGFATPGLRRLNRYPFERFGIAEPGFLADLAVGLEHELLEVPFLPWLGDLALVLLESRNLPAERGGGVDLVVACGYDGHPDSLALVPLVALPG